MIVTPEKKRKADELLTLANDLMCGNISTSYALGNYSPDTVLNAIALMNSFDTAIKELLNLSDGKLDSANLDILAVLCNHFEEMHVTGWMKPTMLGKASDDNPELEFPRGVFSADVERYIDSVAESQQVDRAAAAVAVLAVISTAVQGKFSIWYPDSSNHLDTLNLYCLIVASPSERKTSVSRYLMKPVYEWQHSRKESYKKEIAMYEADMKAAKASAVSAAKAMKHAKTDTERDTLTHSLKDAEMKSACLVKPVSPYNIFGDITPEALARSMQECGEYGAIFNDEPTTLKIMSGLYNDGKVGNIGIFLHSFDGSPVDIRRASGDVIHLDNPLLTMLVYGQPKIVDDILTNPELIDNGMISRFCVCFPKSKVEERKAFIDVTPDAAAFEQFSTTIMNYLDIPRPEQTKKLYFSEESKQFMRSDGYLQYLVDLPKKGHALHDHGEEAGKIPGLFIRICGLLHLLENPGLYSVFKTDAKLPPIEVDTVKRAIHISKYFVDTLIWFTNRNDSLDASVNRKVFDAILDQTIYRGAAFTDIHSINVMTRRTQGLKTAKELKSVLYQLQDAGLISLDDKCTGTKKTLVFINPLAAYAELGREIEAPQTESDNSKPKSPSIFQ